MSVKVSSWVWHSDECLPLVGSELVFLLALADVAGDEGRCRFVDDESDLTYRSLAVKARVSVRTVATIVAKLRELGLLEHVPGAKGRPNEFRIVVPWAKKSDADVASNGSGTDATVASNGTDSMQSATTFDANQRTPTSLLRIDVLTGAEAPAKKRGSRIPDRWRPSEAMRSYAVAKAPSIDVDAEVENFVDYWQARPGAGGVKLDWDATWRTWVRRAHAQNVRYGWQAATWSVPEGQEWMAR